MKIKDQNIVRLHKTIKEIVKRTKEGLIILKKHNPGLRSKTLNSKSIFSKFKKKKDLLIFLQENLVKSSEYKFQKGGFGMFNLNENVNPQIQNLIQSISLDLVEQRINFQSSVYGYLEDIDKMYNSKTQKNFDAADWEKIMHDRELFFPSESKVFNFSEMKYLADLHKYYLDLYKSQKILLNHSFRGAERLKKQDNSFLNKLKNVL